MDDLELEIFKAGDYGEKGAWDEAALDRIAAAYDPRLHEAPVTLDHAQSGPALGWVESVRRVGDRLVARLRGLSARLVELIRSGAFKKRSVELYPSLREAGGPYLRAVSFLGAAAPEVKGLADVDFDGLPGGANGAQSGDHAGLNGGACLLEAPLFGEEETGGHVAVEMDATGEADAASTNDATQDGTQEQEGKTQAADATGEKNEAAESIDSAAQGSDSQSRTDQPRLTANLPPEPNALSIAEMASGVNRVNALTTGEKPIEMSENAPENAGGEETGATPEDAPGEAPEDDSANTGSEGTLEELRGRLMASGRWLPTWDAMGIADFWRALAAVDDVAAGPDATISPAEWFGRFLEELPALVTMSEVAPARRTTGWNMPAEPRGGNVDPDSLAIHRRVVRFMESNPGLGYGEALARCAG